MLKPIQKPVVKREYTFGERIYLWEILKGLKLTWKHFTFNVRASFRPGPHTVPTCWQYPEDRRPIAPIFRGAHYLVLDDEGRELCVGCGMCARACPAKCITVKRGKPAEGEEGKYAGKTMCSEFEIDMLRCIFCGFCEEACPKGAIKLGPEYELAEYDMESCIYNKEKLLANFHKAKAEGKLKPPKKPVPVAGGDKKPAAKKAAGAAKGKAAAKAAPKKAAAKAGAKAKGAKPEAKAETKAEEKKE
jgi:NADH-quinone oxidoreductase subunit I